MLYLINEVSTGAGMLTHKNRASNLQVFFRVIWCRTSARKLVTTRLLLIPKCLFYTINFICYYTPLCSTDQSMSTLFDYICTCLNKKLHKLLMYYFRIWTSVYLKNGKQSKLPHTIGKYVQLTHWVRLERETSAYARICQCKRSETIYDKLNPSIIWKTKLQKTDSFAPHQ